MLMGKEEQDKRTFTKEQIFRDLEQTLTPYEWCRIQKVSEEAAKTCGLCWLCCRIESYMGTSSSWWMWDPNPNFSFQGWKSCRSRFPDEPDFLCEGYEGLDDCMPWDGSYELAREFWALHRTSPHYDIPPELAMGPPESHDPAERWADFPYGPHMEDPRCGYYTIIIHPLVLRQFEWEKQNNLVSSFAEYLEGHFEEFAQKWKHSLVDGLHGLTRLSFLRDKGGTIRKQPWRKNPDHRITDLKLEDGWEISVRKADGSLERMPGVYYSLRQGGHRQRRFEDWYSFAIRNQWWLAFHSAPKDESEAKRRDFLRKQLSEINEYLEKDGQNGCPEPDSNDADFAVTGEEWDEMWKVVRSHIHLNVNHNRVEVTVTYPETENGDDPHITSS